jgi:predicted MFS family arabinose efflux permease
MVISKFISSFEAFIIGRILIGFSAGLLILKSNILIFE